MQSNHSKPSINKWAPGLFLGLAALIFLFVIFKTSPYRLLRPYTLTSAEKLIPGDHRKSPERSSWQVLIPIEAGASDAFWMDQIPVTMADYLKCTKADSCPELQHRGYFDKFLINPIYRWLPVTYISWQNALDYCTWSGGTLPTEAQWMAAAGLAAGQTYPWGDCEPSMSLANYDGFYQGLIPAGWLPEGASPYGILDMGGNVREWMMDILPESAGGSTGEDITRMLKGGGSSDFPQVLEITARQWHSQHSAGFNRGFRCVYPAD